MENSMKSEIMAKGAIPPEWMPDAQMERIVCHWSAGEYKASETDRQHYHIMVEDDGQLVRGVYSIADNELCDPEGPTDYAAHTRLTNSRCIGVSVCCMKDAIEEPFDGGEFPMVKKQWEAMADVCAQICKRYWIAVTPETVLGHGEVEAILGTAQSGKWDPLKLPWEPDLSIPMVGARFRSEVRMRLEEL